MNEQDIVARIAEQVAALQGIVDQLYRLGASQGEVQDFERVVGALQGIIGDLTGPPPVAPEERAARLALFRDGLQAPSPEGGLRLRVQDLLNAGITPTALLADLEAFRSGLESNSEDVVLEVMDYLAGWCSPHADMSGPPPVAPDAADAPERVQRELIPELFAGVYQHYKGGLYLVLGPAQHTETDEILIAYVPLTNDPSWTGPRLRVRPIEQFLDVVHDACPDCGKVGTQLSGSGQWMCPQSSTFYGPIRRRYRYVGAQLPPVAPEEAER